MSFICKPTPSSIRFVIEVLGIASPGNVHFFDDSAANVLGARNVGWHPYHVTETYSVIDAMEDALKAIRREIEAREALVLHEIQALEMDGTEPL
jgi:FMN phosphatase YigB (HAD superfamily)